MSVSEKVLWELLRKDRLGFRFRRQVSVGKYFLDFYCASAQLAVELDGEQHEKSREYDAKRDEFLLSCGIEVIRVPTLDLFDEAGVKSVLWEERIRLRCQERVDEFQKRFG